MLSQDFAPNRLEVAKEVAEEFIRSRPIDRMGLVIFPVKAIRYVRSRLTRIL